MRRACDDAVILSGVEAHDYASALIAFASGMSREMPSQAAALIGRNGIETRVAAMIDNHRSRRRSRKSDRIIPAVVAIAGGIVASLTTPAQSAFAMLAPIVVAAQTSSVRIEKPADTAREAGKNPEKKLVSRRTYTAVDDNEAAIAGLASLLADPNPIVRQSALDAMRSWGAGGRSILRSLADGADSDRAAAARTALAAIGAGR